MTQPLLHRRLGVLPVVVRAAWACRLDCPNKSVGCTTKMVQTARLIVRDYSKQNGAFDC